LCGIGAVRSGTLRHPEVEFFGRFDREPMAVDRDRLGWFAAATWWRPPGAWIFNDPDHQTEALRLAAGCLEVFDSVAPMQARRQALLSLHTRHMEEATAFLRDIPERAHRLPLPILPGHL
jgi:hypothetical protein